MLEVILVIVALGIVGVLALAASKPNAFRIERRALINAPPEKLFSLVDDFHNWPQWSPWEKLDPTMQRTYSGPQRGKGASYAWAGAGKSGEGRMEITESAPSSRILIRLDFIKPMRATNTADFTFTPKGAATEVIWAMYGPSPFMAKVMHTVMNMDKLVGKDFEAGLAAMKATAEKS